MKLAIIPCRRAISLQPSLRRAAASAASSGGNGLTAISIIP
jgi:hypothetical protein